MNTSFFRTAVCLLLATAGCSNPPPSDKPVHVEPHVRLVKAEKRTIVRDVGQPGVIDAYEQTAIYSKVAGYVKEWKVDIGDRIKKDQVIAYLFVPELQAEYLEKKAQTGLDEVMIEVSKQMVDVAYQTWKAAEAQVAVAKANVDKSRADVERWESEVKRLTSVGDVVDRQVLAESRKQLKANQAALEAAQVSVQAAQAEQLARKASQDKAKVDVKASEARALVSKEDEKRVAALLGYTQIPAPYDGIVVVRNVNTGDYVQPGSGDLTTGRGTPLYLLARTDKVRVYVDVPEFEANSVKAGTKATVRVQSLDDAEFDASVTRTSWALRQRSRTLRAEIDLANPDASLLPGAYAYGRVRIEHRQVRAVPLRAVVELGNQNYVYLYDKGKAVQTAVQKGIDDGKWVEVIKTRSDGRWLPFTGEEEVIVGDLAELSNDRLVEVDSSSKEQR